MGLTVHLLADMCSRLLANGWFIRASSESGMPAAALMYRDGESAEAPVERCWTTFRRECFEKMIWSPLLR
jgi:hypothetical protein